MCMAAGVWINCFSLIRSVGLIRITPTVIKACESH